NPFLTCCPLPPASASSGGRDLPPLRGGQSLTACPLPSASAGSGGRDLPPLRGGQSLTVCLYLPPPQAPAAGTFPHFVGDKRHRLPLPSASESSGGRDLSPLRGGQASPFASTSRLRILRRQGPSPTPWGTKPHLLP